MAIRPEDDVAVALRDLAPGPVRVHAGGAIETVTLAEPVPFGHKLARRPVAAGMPVVKYGAAIGTATAAIPAGAHVHVHNLRSRRAQGERGGNA